MRHRSIALAALVLVAAACGGTSDDTAGGTDPVVAAATEQRPGDSPLPALAVYDATSRQTVALDGFIPADRPTLVWFWAPH